MGLLFCIINPSFCFENKVRFNFKNQGYAILNNRRMTLDCFFISDEIAKGIDRTIWDNMPASRMAVGVL